MSIASRSRPLPSLVLSLFLACSALMFLAPPSTAGPGPEQARAAGKSVKLKATTPKAVEAGATTRSKVTLVNKTKKNLKKIKIITKVSGSATVKPRAKKIKKLKKGHKATVRLKIVAGDQPTSKIKVIAKIKGKKVAATRVKQKTEPPSTAGLSGRYFFYKGTTTSSEDEELYFGDGFVNTDIPDEGYVACSAATDDCLPYTFDPASGALTVGGLSGQLGTGSLTLDGSFFQEAVLQAPGTKYAVDLTASYVGPGCPFAGCYSAIFDLTLGADGSYTETVTNNFAGGGTNQGTYEVIDGSRVRLTYVDDDGVGKQEIKAIGVVLDANGQPDPVNEGLVIAGSWYFKYD